MIDKQRTNPAELKYLDLDDVANIVENFENPQYFGENFSDGKENRSSRTPDDIQVERETRRIIDGEGSVFDKARAIDKLYNTINETRREVTLNDKNDRIDRGTDFSVDIDYTKPNNVDRSMRSRVKARDRYEKRVRSGRFQMHEALQDSMLGLKEMMTSILKGEGRKGKALSIENIPDFENPYLGENRLSSVNHNSFKAQIIEVLEKMICRALLMVPISPQMNCLPMGLQNSKRN